MTHEAGHRTSAEAENGTRRPILSSCPLMVMVVLPLVSAYALNNGAARTPPIGWADWNQFGVAPTSTFKIIADSLVSTSLRDVRYTYINRDGGTRSRLTALN